MAARTASDVEPDFGTEAISFWKPATAGKLRLRLGKLVGVTAGRSPVSGNADPSGGAQTLDLSGAAQA